MLFLGAALVGVAAGARLSYVLPIAAFLVSVPVVARSRRWWSLGLFGTGLACGLIPVAITFLLAPASFLFGTLGYARLNVVYRKDVGSYMSLGQKLSYAGSLVAERPTLLLVLLFVAIVALALRHNTERRHQLLFITGVSLCCFMAALLPTPSFIQYFYQPVPFLVLAIFVGLASLQGQSGSREYRVTALLLAAALIGVTHWKTLATYGEVALTDAMHPSRPLRLPEPVTARVYRVAREIRTEGNKGKALTFAPIYPLEAGMKIYPQFSTGPFAYRAAYLLDRQKRQDFKLVSSTDLQDLLDGDPPSGILVGSEIEEDDATIEAAFIQYAKQHDYQPQVLGNRLTEWVPTHLPFHNQP